MREDISHLSAPRQEIIRLFDKIQEIAEAHDFDIALYAIEPNVESGATRRVFATCEKLRDIAEDLHDVALKMAFAIAEKRRSKQ